MAVRLRLMRMGKKKQPTYRIVAADSRSPRDGRFLEIVGTYQPRLEPSGIKIDDGKALKWLRNGAKPSETVEKLLKINGTWEHFEKGTDPAVAEDPAPAPAPAPAKAKTEAPAPAEESVEEPAEESAEPEAPAASDSSDDSAEAPAEAEATS